MWRSGSGSVKIMSDPDPGGPKTCGSYGSGSGSTTLWNVWDMQKYVRFRTLLSWDRLEPFCQMNWCYLWRVCLYLINDTLDWIEWTECSARSCAKTIYINILETGFFFHLCTREGDIEYTGCDNTEHRGLKLRWSLKGLAIPRVRAKISYKLLSTASYLCSLHFVM